MLAKPKEDFGETPCHSSKERLSAEVTRATPVGNWREKRLYVLGEVWGVVTTSIPPPVTPIDICWALMRQTYFSTGIAQWLSLRPCLGLRIGKGDVVPCNI